jgi:hypothetical protein
MAISNCEKFDLVFPGQWIGGANREWAFEVLHLLSLVQHEFTCAVAACSLFEPITGENVFLASSQSKYTASLMSVYARSFVFSLDSISKMLKVLGEHPQAPHAVQKPISEYCSMFGKLRHIRDSLAHIEDRGRALTKKGEPLSSKVIILGSFNESRFEFTGNDGNCYGVDISESTLLSAHQILQAVIDAYAWE